MLRQWWDRVPGEIQYHMRYIAISVLIWTHLWSHINVFLSVICLPVHLVKKMSTSQNLYTNSLETISRHIIWKYFWYLVDGSNQSITQLLYPLTCPWLCYSLLVFQFRSLFIIISHININKTSINVVQCVHKLHQQIWGALCKPVTESTTTN